MIPIVSGYEVLKKVREKNNIPIIVLSSKNMNSDIILGLTLGADDYVTKPFEPLQLIARIKAQLRRFHKLGGGEIDTEQDIKIRDLVLRCRECQLLKRDTNIELTYMEYKLLKFLMSSPEGYIPRSNYLYMYGKRTFYTQRIRLWCILVN